jgi:hypothetical protein
MKIIRILSSSIYGILALVLLATPVQADEKIKSRMVYCDKGQDPADVLNQELGPQRLEMTLVGTCPGFTVTRDDVRIEGDDESGGDDEYVCPDPTARVDGTITFNGAQRAIVACLRVTGQGNGIQASSAASVSIIESSISGNAEAGVFASSGSNIYIGNSSISDNAGAGVFACCGSSISLSGSQAINNGSSGVQLITNTSADIDNSEVTGNGYSDGGAEDLSLSLHTVATGQGNTIGAINLRLDSGVSLDGSISGPVNCADDESSALINGEVPLEGCTGF